MKMKNNKHSFEVRNIRDGIQEVSLNIKQLYSDEMERRQLDERLVKFLAIDQLHSKIFSLRGDSLVYLTEHIVPEKNDLRPPLLMLFGNPAPQSVESEMYFASHSNGSEHRIWRVLREVGFISFEHDANNTTERNRLRKRALYELTYHSPFRIGLAVFYSMPSPSSGQWSGVAGLRRLFWSEGFPRIA